MTTYVHHFRPSQYTTMLLEIIERECDQRDMGDVLDLGVGSGLFLAALACRGAQRLWGVDISAAAVTAAEGLLSVVQPHVPRTLLVGNMWAPLPVNQVFDVIVANLPHFPAHITEKDRPPGWTGGDGRMLIDRFIRALPERLTESGAAYFTHHDLIGYPETVRLLDSLGLKHRSMVEWTVFELPERIAAVSAEILSANGQAIRAYGDYVFAQSRILKISRTN